MSLQGGGTVTAARGVIVAADGPAAVRLLGEPLHSSPSKPNDGVGTACVYFSCGLLDVSPISLSRTVGLLMLCIRGFSVGTTRILARFRRYSTPHSGMHCPVT